MQAEQHVGTAHVIPQWSPCSVRKGHGTVNISNSLERRLQSSSGILPVRKEWCKVITSHFDNAANSDGTPPVNKLSSRVRNLMSAKSPICVGTKPVNELLWSER